MTAVLIAPRVEDLDSDTEAVVTGARFRVRPSQAYVSGGQWVQPLWSAWRPINGTAVTVQLDPVSTPYELEIQFPDDGDGEPFTVHEFRVITSQGSPTAWETFTQVTGPPGTPVLTDAITARLDAQDAAIAALSVSGASDVSTVSGISAFAQTYLDDTTAAATRTTLGAGTSSLAIGTTSSTAKAGDYQPAAANISDSTTVGRAVITATDAAAARTAIGATSLALGTTSSTAKAGDYQPASTNISDATTVGKAVLTATDAAAGRTAIGAAAATDVTANTTAISLLVGGIVGNRAVSGVYPARPVTAATQVVAWIGPTTPPVGGTVSGAAGAVDDLDIWFRTTT